MLFVMGHPQLYTTYNQLTLFKALNFSVKPTKITHSFTCRNKTSGTGYFSSVFTLENGVYLAAVQSQYNPKQPNGGT